MKAFVFKPSNEPRGNFEIEQTKHILDGFLAFVRDHTDVAAYDYIECAGETWTVMGEPNEWCLKDGRLYQAKGDDTGASASAFDGFGRLPAHKRYNNGYRTARTIRKIAKLLKDLGIVIAIIVLVISLIVSKGVVAGVILAIVNAIASGAGLYVFGVLLGGIGEILMVNLDQAVHSSPFLTDDQRAEIMSIDLEDLETDEA